MKVIILLSILFTAACVPSLNPLYTDADLTSDAALVGTWLDKETGETWTFSNRENLKYTLVHTDFDGRRAEYDARLVKVEDKLFLDMVSAKPRLAQTDFYNDRSVSAHNFALIVRKESTVEISYLEPRWLKDHLAEDPRAIRHERIRGEIFLAASPKETQAFLISHLSTPGAFSRPAELSRKRGGS